MWIQGSAAERYEEGLHWRLNSRSTGRSGEWLRKATPCRADVPLAAEIARAMGGAGYTMADESFRLTEEVWVRGGVSMVEFDLEGRMSLHGQDASFELTLCGRSGDARRALEGARLFRAELRSEIAGRERASGGTLSALHLAKALSIEHAHAIEQFFAGHVSIVVPVIGRDRLFERRYRAEDLVLAAGETLSSYRRVH